MDIPHLLILELGALATVVTLYGGIASFISARRQVREEQRRVVIAERLYNWERAEAARPRGSDEDDAALREKYEQLYKDFGIVRATYDNMHFLGAYEAARMSSVALKGAQSNLIIVAVGVLLGGAAGVWGTVIG